MEDRKKVAQPAKKNEGRTFVFFQKRKNSTTGSPKERMVENAIPITLAAGTVESCVIITSFLCKSTF